MAWIESHTVLRNHRKVLVLSRALRLNTAQTIGHLHLLWHAALEQQENGDLTQWSDELIAELAGYTGDAPQFVRRLQEFGWLDGKVLHHWWDYAGRYLQGKYGREPEKWQAIKSLFANKQQTVSKQFATPNLPNQPTIKQPPPAFDFNSLWAKYPNKDGKKEAERHFKASVKTEKDWQDINQALDNYLKTDRVKKGFIKNGSTWFNNWRDWVIMAEYKNNPHAARGEHVLQEIKEWRKKWEEEQSQEIKQEAV